MYGEKQSRKRLMLLVVCDTVELRRLCRRCARPGVPGAAARCFCARYFNVSPVIQLTETQLDYILLLVRSEPGRVRCNTCVFRAKCSGRLLCLLASLAFAPDDVSTSARYLERSELIGCDSLLAIRRWSKRARACQRGDGWQQVRALRSRRDATTSCHALMCAHMNGASNELCNSCLMVHAR